MRALRLVSALMAGFTAAWLIAGEAIQWVDIERARAWLRRRREFVKSSPSRWRTY